MISYCSRLQKAIFLTLYKMGDGFQVLKLPLNI